MDFLKELVKNQAFTSALTGLLALALFNVGLKLELVNAVVAVASAFLAALAAYWSARAVRAARRAAR